MERRTFIRILGGAATWPLAARAQQPITTKRIAVVNPVRKLADMGPNRDPQKGFDPQRALIKELTRVGYVEGQNLVVDRYSGEGRTGQFTDLARDVVSTRPDLIFVIATPLALKFKMATETIPIVALTGDPVAAGLVASFARPGGNITGTSADAGLEIWGKRLELLLEAIPKPSNVRFLAMRMLWEASHGAMVRELAKQVGISVSGALLDGAINETEYQRLFTAMQQDRVDALMVSDDVEHYIHRQLLVEMITKSQIPAIYSYREHVELGGLMAYSFDLADMFSRAADQIGQIFRGTNPGDIPFYQQTKFELVINMKTAKTLGLELPATLLARADEVIE